MPSSALVMWPTIIAHLEPLEPRSVLDVGCGHGKAAVLCREYLPSVRRVVGVEAWEPYVEEFRLRYMYDAVYPVDVLELDKYALNSCDVVLMGDVIEHLTKGDGLDLLARIAKPVVVCTPEHFFDNPPDLPWTETHRSHWTRSDFEGTGRVARYSTAHGGQVVTLGPR